MKTVRNELDEREQELVSHLIKDCKTTGEIQTKLKRLFAGTIGAVALIEDAPLNWNIKEGVYAIKPDPMQILSKFLLNLLRSNVIRAAFLSKAAGGHCAKCSNGRDAEIENPHSASASAE